MKVLLTTDRYYPAVNGVITSVMNLKHELERRGHEVKILTLSNTKNTHIEGNIIYLGSLNANMIYPEVRIKHPIFRSTIRQLVDWHPDIIHSNCEFSTFFVAKKIARLTKSPMVHTYHTDYEDYVHYVALSKKVGKNMVAIYVRYIAEHMTRMICPTEKTANTLKGYGLTTPMDIIPTGLNLEKFEHPLLGERKEALSQRYGLVKDRLTLIFIGRLGKEKNLLEILQNLSAETNTPFQFLIVGDGPDKNEIISEVKENGLTQRTIFTGMIAQNEIADFYRLGDIFVSASQSETQGLTFIEALSAGLPLLCKKDNALEHVLLQGQNGYAFSNQEEFSRYFHLLADNKERRKEMGIFAKENAFSRFGASTFCDKVLACYAEALEENKNNPRRISFLRRCYYIIKSKIPLV